MMLELFIGESHDRLSVPSTVRATVCLRELTYNARLFSLSMA